MTLSVPGSLLRRFVVDWLAKVDPSVPPQIMAPDYTVAIGGVELRGLDSYVPATVTQYSRYPGLLLTVHEAVAAAGRTALRFTLHGAGPHRAPVAWTGIALFAHDGHRLTRSWVEEDYFARRRQQATGECDPIEPPVAAPWSLEEAPPDPRAEAVVRDWLAAADLDGVRLDDGSSDRVLEGKVEPLEVFSAGDRVAFYAEQAGTYRGGLPDTDAEAGRPASWTMAGLVRVTADGPRGHVVRDRLGLRRRLQQGTS